MPRHRPDHVNELLRKGRSLEDIGINNWGLTPEYSLEVIDRLKDTPDLKLLGGDVLTFIEGTLCHSYDSWSFPERGPQQTVEAHCKYSFEVGKKYISTYRKLPGGVLYELVFSSTIEEDDEEEPQIIESRIAIARTDYGK